jgi:hypothetical protein
LVSLAEAIRSLFFPSSSLSPVDSPTVSVWTVPATLNHDTWPPIFLFFFPNEIITSTAVFFLAEYSAGAGEVKWLWQMLGEGWWLRESDEAWIMDHESESLVFVLSPLRTNHYQHR